MSPRSIRRAAERKARKEARKEALRQEKLLAQQAQPSRDLEEAVFASHAPAPDEQLTPISPARLTANRANAQLSTGPISADGRAKVSRNALKGGLTGRTVLLPSDDPQRYQAILDEFEQRYQPETPVEQELVQSICAAFWRLCRIPALERALFAKGRREFADAFPEEHDAERRSLLIDGEVLLKYDRQFRNLALQDSRLHRKYEKLTAELLKLQQQRPEPQEAPAPEEPEILDTPQIEAPDRGDLGFEFSTRETQELLEAVGAASNSISAPESKQMEAQAA